MALTRPKGNSVSTALITGGAGFIGSNLADAVLADGRACHIVDDLSNGKRIRLPGDAEFHELDIRRADDLVAVATAAKPSVIFHLAAQADVRRALDDPAFDADVNVIGTINVLEAARAVGARVVFASTGGAGYGEYPELPVPSPETSATRPLSHYGMSKMAGEGYCGLYGRLYGVPATVLRLGNVYGPRQDPHGEAGVVAIFCGKVLDGDRPRIFGDGLQTRDYVYVGDVVRAFLAAEAGEPGETVNIGTGTEITVLDLLEGLGYEGDPEFADARPGELQRSALDNAKAAALYGWRPETSLRDGLRLTYESVIAARQAPDARPPGAFATT
jgi:UDP-glucose 4-epimerase